MAKQWYVVHTLTGHEDRVKASLQRRAASGGIGDRLGRVLVLTEEELRGTRRGRRQVTRHKTFPGYVFVEMDLDDQMRTLVQSTSGVTGFVGPDRQAVPLRPEEMANILAASSEEAPRVRAAWHEGENIRIIAGPFEGFVGRVEEVNLAKEMVKVMVSIFGRETPVDLDFADVEKLG